MISNMVLIMTSLVLKDQLATALTDACTMLPFDNYTDLTCKVSGWYNDTKLPCNTYKAADEGDASFLYVPVGLTVTVFCPIRNVLVGASEYTCDSELGGFQFDPPIKLSNITKQIDPHPVCLSVNKMQGALCDSDSLPRSRPHYKLYSNTDFVFVDQEYRVECEAGYSTAVSQDRMLYGECSQRGVWSVTGSECLGMCLPEVRYGGTERNTATLYQSYTEIQATTQLGTGLQAVGTEVNITITCEAGHSPTGSRSGSFTLTCTVANNTAVAGYYSHSRKEPVVNCKRDCEVPALPEGKLIDPWTGLTLVTGTRTLKNGPDAARMRCPTGTYALGRVRIECYDGVITHQLPICTRDVQPCEAPLITHGTRDPYSLGPGETYTLQCFPGYALSVTTSPEVLCRGIPDRVTDLGVPATQLSPASSYICHAGCSMPFTTLSHGTLHPTPNLTGTPYSTGTVITISCFTPDTHSHHTCSWDGWDSEQWPECTPSGLGRKGLSGVLITWTGLWLLTVLPF